MEHLLEMGFVTGRKMLNGIITVQYVQLFQLTLSVQSMKLRDETESLRGIFMNKFIKISHAWRKQ